MAQPIEQAENSVARKGGPAKSRSSFSLIELLAVVAIIMVLVGIALKVNSYVQRRTGSARTVWVLEQVKNALASYYTVYGSYPPGYVVGGTNVYYEYRPTGAKRLPADPDDGYGSQTGLVYYLWSGGRDNPDVEAQRWQHYLKDLRYGPVPNARKGRSQGSGMVLSWTNMLESIHDGWDRELMYESFTPCQSFRLWSVGANGANEYGKGDDIGVQWME